MSALTKRLPRNWSRTRTHAISVPTTALMTRRDERDADRELERARRLAARDRVPERIEAAFRGADHDGGQGQQDDEAQPQRRDAEAEDARPGGRASQGQGGGGHPAVDTPASSSIFAIAPPSMSKSSSLTFSQPPRSSMVKRPGGSGNWSLFASRTVSLTGR